jgi:hypothetical protein
VEERTMEEGTSEVFEWSRSSNPWTKLIKKKRQLFIMNHAPRQL